MKIGFYAPLKPPGHPDPSGDRKMARLLIAAMGECGHTVDVISTLRAWEGKGSGDRQSEIRNLAGLEVERLTRAFSENQPPDLVFTYHVYHKAPDWIGPEISNRFDIPYVIAELSVAPKQEGGKWDTGYQQSLHCLRQARTIINLNSVDAECIAKFLDSHQSMQLVKPFMRDSSPDSRNREDCRKKLAAKYKLDPEAIWLLSIAMMRPGAKLASYRSLADALQRVQAGNYRVVLVGDGRTRAEVESGFDSIREKCLFTGALEAGDIQDWLAASDMYVWPSVNEAYGMALLEAVSSGLPVVAQRYGGVPMLVDSGVSGILVEQEDNAGFASAVEQLIQDRVLRSSMSKSALFKFHDEHSFEVAVNTLGSILEPYECKKQ